MSSQQDTSFARLVSLACHDLRTPLATAHGFARTLERTVELEPPAARYVEMIGAASLQLAGILDTLSLVARIEGGRWEPNLQPIELLELARAAAAEVVDGEVTVAGAGGSVSVDEEAFRSALRDFGRCALRHGGLKEVELAVAGSTVRLSPIVAAAAPVIIGEALRDLGAAVAVSVVQAHGGSVELKDDELVISLPAAATS
jgi:signal transduction histidine kinase